MGAEVITREQLIEGYARDAASHAGDTWAEKELARQTAREDARRFLTHIENRAFDDGYEDGSEDSRWSDG